MRSTRTTAGLLLVVVVALACSWGIADADEDIYGVRNQPRHVFIQSKLQKQKVAVKCTLNNKKEWGYPRWVAPGKEVEIQPRDDELATTATYRCAVWTRATKKWCRFLVYNSDTHFGDCLGFGCRYLLMEDGIYYGVMQNFERRYTGGPYRKVFEWC